MVNDLRDLMHESVASPPPDGSDLHAVLAAGRRGVRRRRAGIAGAAVVAMSTVVVTGTLLWPNAPSRTQVAASGVPQPHGPALRLSDAEAASAGTDYQVLAEHTNHDLDADNGFYFDGATDDGQLLWRAPDATDATTRLALMDPETRVKDLLPASPFIEQLHAPIELGEDRLVFHSLAPGGDMRSHPEAVVYDRAARAWTRVSWTGLPKTELAQMVMGPDGRVYLGIQASHGQPPPGGWPTGPDGEVDDADAEGDTYRLWSASLTDPNDIRDEQLTVGNFAFTDDALVWSERTNGVNDRIHVRDLATGAERDFDPGSGTKCNLLTFGATGDRIVLGQYCGTYGDGRDDRVQIITTDGTPVTTIQDDGIDGTLRASDGGPEGLVAVTSLNAETEGTYVYDLESDRFVQVSDSVSSYGAGGPTPPGYLLWHTALNQRKGETQVLAAWP